MVVPPLTVKVPLVSKPRNEVLNVEFQGLGITTDWLGDKKSLWHHPVCKCVVSLLSGLEL